MCQLTVNAIHLVHKLRPLILHASSPGVQSAQALAGKASPVDDIRDVALLLSAAQQFLASHLPDVLKVLHPRKGRG